MHACLIQRVPWQASCLTDYIEETTFCSVRQRPRKHTTFQELLRWSAKCMLCRNMPECILESTCPHSDTLDKPSSSSSFQAIRPLCSAMPSHFVLLMLVVVCERHNVPQLFVEKNLYHQGEVFTVKSISSMCARDQTGMEAWSEQVNGQNTDVWVANI